MIKANFTKPHPVYGMRPRFLRVHIYNELKAQGYFDEQDAPGVEVETAAATPPKRTAAKRLRKKTR
jgi:hypothetical protein